MLKKLFISFVIAFSFAFQANAYTDNYLCAMYEKIRIRNVDRVLAVGIRRIYQASVETYVLGFGTPIKTTINDIKLTEDNISKRRTLQCRGVTIGHVRFYELSNLGLKNGLFVIESGDKSASTYIEID
jgi:hypothetical protein